MRHYWNPEDCYFHVYKDEEGNTNLVITPITYFEEYCCLSDGETEPSSDAFWKALNEIDKSAGDMDSTWIWEADLDFEPFRTPAEVEAHMLKCGFKKNDEFSEDMDGSFEKEDVKEEIEVLKSTGDCKKFIQKNIEEFIRNEWCHEDEAASYNDLYIIYNIWTNGKRRQKK